MIEGRTEEVVSEVLREDGVLITVRETRISEGGFGVTVERGPGTVRLACGSLYEGSVLTRSVATLTPAQARHVAAVLTAAAEAVSPVEEYASAAPPLG